MGLLTNDPQAKKVFGQNITACLALTGKDMNWLVSETKLGKKLLGDIQAGTGHVTKDIVDTISKVFNLELLDIVRSYGPVERRYEQLRTLLEDAGNCTLPEVKAPIIVTGPTVSIQRVEALSRPVPVIVMEPPAPNPQPLEKISKEILATLEKTFPTQQQTRRDEPKSVVPVQVVTKNVAVTKKPKLPQKTPSIHVSEKFEAAQDHPGLAWNQSGTVAILNGTSYDLTSKSFRQEFGRRLRYLKGPLSFETFRKKFSPKKSSTWLVSLNAGSGILLKKDLEELATICEVSIVSLLSGEGIVGVSVKQTAVSWMEEYEKTMGDGPELMLTAIKMQHKLKPWPIATRVMLLKYLAEMIAEY